MFEKQISTRGTVAQHESISFNFTGDRYFVLDFETGILQYFVNEQSKTQKPRGTLSLAGAIISPSDEVPHMLVVYSANGEIFKLRAADAKEKQYWINQLRSCAKHHKEGNSKSISSSRSRSSSLLPPGTVNSPSGQKHMNQSGPTVVTITHHKSPAAARRAKSQRSGQLHEVREMMSQVEGQQKNLVQAIEALPSSGPLSALDQDLLLLKATSAATLSCLGECLTLLQQSMHQVGQHHNRTLSSDGILGWPGPKSHSSEQLKNGALSSLSSASANITWAIVPSAAQDGQTLQPGTEHSASELVLVEDEATDTEDNEEEDLGVMDDQRSVILHLISQLKLGMDLTRDPAKESGQDQSTCYKLRFVAEQVSHHPPVSCFYCECKEKKMCVNAHVWTKSKFMGMSIGVSMVGEGVLYLLEHEEEYVFTLPSAYARSILTIPWVELGGKVNINCARTGYSATVTFHTKPFYGGKVHRVTAEVKHNPTNTIVCKAQGEWNGTLEFTYSNGETKVIDTSKLPVTKKKIRPIAKQGPLESRHLWQHVTNSLKEGNIDAATEHKHRLEERQRAEERQRTALSTPWKPKYFAKE
ncbi:hypothetical protein ASZ78_008669, partial [Callipepla squamata]